MQLPEVLSWVVALTIALTVHEFSHAWVADRCGDPTARAMGRVTLNPLAHYDLIGSTMILLFGWGWGKPVPVNPAYFKHPRRDDILVSFAGVASNLIIATAFAMPIRFGEAGIYAQVFAIIIQLNLVLAVFNLIPVYPLDGSHILAALLPPRSAREMGRFYATHGRLVMIALLVLVWTNSLRIIIGIPVTFLFRHLTGY